ncbi:type IV-A pilus assembly ATPase PilB [Larsenimonas rhizosphaerae]|uniref:type IV-A pilus assembly ATPase PilB n=1 Tax=Larsenimonas rhizosphaerae TaxID=2944682 RepID=UPI0020343968|nr:type IV-A pilus assembly ATPase PilB [Larsenimonas rhizosphaerae]MCM2131028.1 type IV-A pilus assembly ATPase PilB [Larsenimonas rhizosphaerae]
MATSSLYPVGNALRGLAKRLVQDGLLSEEDALAASEKARELETTLMDYLISRSYVTGRQAALAAAQEFGLGCLELDAVPLARLPLPGKLPEDLLRRLSVLPLIQGEHSLTIALGSPAALNALDELQFVTGHRVEAVLVPPDQLERRLEEYLNAHFQGAMALLDDDGSFDDLSIADEDEADDQIVSLNDDAPVVRFVNKLMLDAIRRNASDIHFEPYETSYRIRFRIDGILTEAARPPQQMRQRLAARLKVMAKLDISERRLPQDGSIKLKVSAKKQIDFRVNTLPTVYGEKIVMRLLDPSSARLGIDKLGFLPAQKTSFEKALSHPQGMILVTGPTGSGKTVTLYTALNILNTETRNIATAEDPVELKLEGINQVNVMPRIGLDFASALRAFLRQDPDVVMVGEVRDIETAEVAIKAAQTGHLVLSTLHTNSATETLTRLRNMGVAAFNVATSVSLIIAQRLARRLCDHCKERVDLPELTLQEEGFTEQDLRTLVLYRPRGCARCTQGYKGRVGLYEVLPISDAMSRLIMEDGSSIDLADLARREGHHDLRRSGLIKVMEGVTSLEEVNRVTRG